MLINEELEKQNITKYRLSKESGVPQATINDICSGKADIERCAAGTLYRLSKVLGISIEAIIESAAEESRSSFENFKSSICHYVKDMGDLDFIVDVLEKDQVRVLFEKKWYYTRYIDKCRDRKDSRADGQAGQTVGDGRSTEWRKHGIHA